MLRSILLFVHVCSAMGMFAALGVEAAALRQLGRGADAPDVRAALQGYWLVPRVGALSLAVALLSGAYLATTAWGWQVAWIDVSVAGLVLIAAVGATMTRRGVASLQTAGADAGGGPSRSGSWESDGDRVLRASFAARLAILAGIVFLMTVKPGLEGSLVAMAVAVAAAGFGSYASLRRRAPDATGVARGGVP